MVWRWPVNKFTSEKLLETAVIPNSSNIRLIRRIKNDEDCDGYREYWRALEENTLFHHNFWSQNNKLHAQEYKISTESGETEAHFYKKFTEKRATEFAQYHRETWRRNWELVGIGYRCIYQKIIKKIKGNKKEQLGINY